MIDPLLKGFDMPLLSEPPIRPEQVPRLDAIFITHCDNDHFSRETCKDLSAVCPVIHTTAYVDSLIQGENLANSRGHAIGDSFSVGDVRIIVTPADHAWQNDVPEFSYRQFKQEDCCGFRLDTPDGSIWMPGDSRLMTEQLSMPQPDVILLDFSDSTWHIGLDGTKKLTDAYRDAILLPIHWGCVDAPEMPEFNGDPARLREIVQNPERIRVLAPGEPFDLQTNPIQA